jgi:CheY-like chemotaxis protein
LKVETEVKQTNEALQILVVEDYSLIAMLLDETLAEMGERVRSGGHRGRAVKDALARSVSSVKEAISTWWVASGS